MAAPSAARLCARHIESPRRLIGMLLVMIAVQMFMNGIRVFLAH